MVVNFALNRTNVDAAYLPNLERIGQDLAQQDGLRIALKAYSDKSGKAEYNQIISEKRAQSVLEIIAGQGARQHQIDLEILGASQATDRYSPDARRVEVILAKP
jgi:OOP family OmpA-OmpF porin